MCSTNPFSNKRRSLSCGSKKIYIQPGLNQTPVEAAEWRAGKRAWTEGSIAERNHHGGFEKNNPVKAKRKLFVDAEKRFSRLPPPPPGSMGASIFRKPTESLDVAKVKRKLFGEQGMENVVSWIKQLPSPDKLASIKKAKFSRGSVFHGDPPTVRVLPPKPIKLPVVNNQQSPSQDLASDSVSQSLKASKPVTAPVAGKQSESASHLLSKQLASKAGSQQKKFPSPSVAAKQSASKDSADAASTDSGRQPLMASVPAAAPVSAKHAASDSASVPVKVASPESAIQPSKPKSPPPPTVTSVIPVSAKHVASESEPVEVASPESAIQSPKPLKPPPSAIQPPKPLLPPPTVIAMSAKHEASKPDSQPVEVAIPESGIQPLSPQKPLKPHSKTVVKDSNSRKCKGSGHSETDGQSKKEGSTSQNNTESAAGKSLSNNASSVSGSGIGEANDDGDGGDKRNGPRSPLSFIPDAARYKIIIRAGLNILNAEEAATMGAFPVGTRIQGLTNGRWIPGVITAVAYANTIVRCGLCYQSRYGRDSAEEGVWAQLNGFYTADSIRADEPRLWNESASSSRKFGRFSHADSETYIVTEGNKKYRILENDEWKGVFQLIRRGEDGSFVLCTRKYTVKGLEIKKMNTKREMLEATHFADIFSGAEGEEIMIDDLGPMEDLKPLDPHSSEDVVETEYSCEFQDCGKGFLSDMTQHIHEALVHQMSSAQFRHESSEVATPCQKGPSARTPALSVDPIQLEELPAGDEDDHAESNDLDYDGGQKPNKKARKPRKSNKSKAAGKKSQENTEADGETETNAEGDGETEKKKSSIMFKVPASVSQKTLTKLKLARKTLKDPEEYGFNETQMKQLDEAMDERYSNKLLSQFKQLKTELLETSRTYVDSAVARSWSVHESTKSYTERDTFANRSIDTLERPHVEQLAKEAKENRLQIQKEKREREKCLSVLEAKVDKVFSTVEDIKAVLEKPTEICNENVPPRYTPPPSSGGLGDDELSDECATGDENRETSGDEGGVKYLTVTANTPGGSTRNKEVKLITIHGQKFSLRVPRVDYYSYGTSPDPSGALRPDSGLPFDLPPTPKKRSLRLERESGLETVMENKPIPIKSLQELIALGMWEKQRKRDYLRILDNMVQKAPPENPLVAVRLCDLTEKYLIEQDKVYLQRVRLLKEMFPRHVRQIANEIKVRNEIQTDSEYASSGICETDSPAGSLRQKKKIASQRKKEQKRQELREKLDKSGKGDKYSQPQKQAGSSRGGASGKGGGGSGKDDDEDYNPDDDEDDDDEDEDEEEEEDIEDEEDDDKEDEKEQEKEPPPNKSASKSEIKTSNSSDSSDGYAAEFRRKSMPSDAKQSASEVADKGLQDQNQCQSGSMSDTGGRSGSGSRHSHHGDRSDSRTRQDSSRSRAHHDRSTSRDRRGRSSSRGHRGRSGSRSRCGNRNSSRSRGRQHRSRSRGSRQGRQGRSLSGSHRGRQNRSGSGSRRGRQDRSRSRGRSRSGSQSRGRSRSGSRRGRQDRSRSRGRSRSGSRRGRQDRSRSRGRSRSRSGSDHGQQDRSRSRGRRGHSGSGSRRGRQDRSRSRGSGRGRKDRSRSGSRREHRDRSGSGYRRGRQNRSGSRHGRQDRSRSRGRQDRSRSRGSSRGRKDRSRSGSRRGHQDRSGSRSRRSRQNRSRSGSRRGRQDRSRSRGRSSSGSRRGRQDRSRSRGRSRSGSGSGHGLQAMSNSRTPPEDGSRLPSKEEIQKKVESGKRTNAKPSSADEPPPSKKGKQMKSKASKEDSPIRDNDDFFGDDETPVQLPPLPAIDSFESRKKVKKSLKRKQPKSQESIDSDSDDDDFKKPLKKPAQRKLPLSKGPVMKSGNRIQV